MIIPAWLKKADDTIPAWLEKISLPDMTGRFKFCLNGRTRAGEKAALGFSCFALRIFYTIGLWDKLDSGKKLEWIKFLQSFQSADGAFIDPPILENCDSWKERLKRILLRRKGHRGISQRQSVLNAETKQAIATLAQASAQALYPFKDFSRYPYDLKKYFADLDWTQPWSAGGQAAATAAFIKNEAPKFLSKEDADLLMEEAVSFFKGTADPQTGAWFSGRMPAHYQIINGAMKALTALDWLECKIPYPEKLIDTCLLSLPEQEGCHIVDYVYVLYRCCQATDYRRQEILKYLENILNIIKRHYQPDGAFSYHETHNQTAYYGVKIARPMRQSDLQATFLLCFAIAMLASVLEIEDLKWNVIRP
ncbi:MAG: hypothetical protein HY806_09505 [Nitrospirae bacterium]|nr:hypothetical protein [Nitrospirota bacterium]MBI4839353.1 hypothetical protein [Nitrospirota bacterium]